MWVVHLEQKLAAARKRWADETLQSSIRTTDRETIEGILSFNSFVIHLADHGVVAHSPDTGGEAWPIFGNRRFNFQKKAPQVIHQVSATGFVWLRNNAFNLSPTNSGSI